MKRMLLLLSLFLVVGVQSVLAQTRTIKGRVLDENGEGVPGASVKVKGTQTGTVADIDGNYTIEVPEASNTLIISALGIGEQEAKIQDASQPVIVKLEKNATDLEEATVMGTKIDPRSYSGSVTTVTAAEIAKRPITNILSALSGTAPGIQVTSGGGQPGSSPQIVMRGFGSLSANNSPLIVMDGAVFQGTMASINPNDVESISLLKDAPAAALYGARGGNGVILITSKKGKKSDKPKISIDAQVGITNRQLPLYETVNAKEYLETAWEGYKRSSPSPSEAGFLAGLGGYNPFKVPAGEGLFVREGAFDVVNPGATQLYNDSWFEEISRTGIRHQYNVSVANGDDRSDYYFSVGYNNDQGVIKESSYDRISTRLNVNSKINNWLKTGINLAGTFDNQRSFVTTNNAFQNPFLTAQTMAPIYPVYRYDDNGNRMYNADGSPIYDFGSENGRARPFAYNMNTIASLYLDDRTSRNLQALGVTYLEAKFAKDFTARANFDFNYYNGRRNSFQNMEFGDAENVSGRYNRTFTNQFVYTFRQLVTWSPSFGAFSEGHNLDISAVHENYALKYDNAYSWRTGFTDKSFREGDAAAVNEISGGSEDNHRLESYIASAAYNYKQKYFFNASLNRNGTSRFAPKVRWGTFYAVSAGWMLSEESFIKDKYNWVDMLKLRASYGISGVEDLGGSYYPWLARYSFNPNGGNPGYTFSSWGNENLKWEGQAMFNVGLDFGIFSNRLSGTIEYYLRQSKDLLYVRPIAPSTGISGIQENIGKTQNAGIELTLRGDVVRKTNFNWNVQLNVTHYKNKIIEVQGEDSVLYGSGTIFGKGYSVMDFFMPHVVGIDPANGDVIYSADVIRDPASGDLIPNPSGTTTDYQVANLVENRKRVGSAIRDLEGGITNTFNYKGFELSFLVTFGIGGKFYDNTYAGLMGADNGRAGNGRNWHKDILNRWRQPGDVTDVPRVDFGAARTDINGLSDRFLTSNSFLSIKSANLGYNIPAKLMKGSGFQSAKVFVAAENIWLFAARKGLDIQQSFFGTSSFNYSPYRTIMFGVNLGL
jgi:TonB-linked SusC/RagA family outer membrane protein